MLRVGSRRNTSDLEACGFSQLNIPVEVVLFSLFFLSCREADQEKP
jgi:hypothetical protein